MLKTKGKSRRTPWDTRAIKACLSSAPPSPAEPRPFEKLKGGVCLHGIYVFDPRVCTSRDMRHFFWAGLQLLDSEVKSLGLPQEEVRQLMLASFDTFHDAASGLWDAVRQMIAAGGESVTGARAVAARCHILPAVTGSGSGRTSYPISIPALPTPAAINNEGAEIQGGCALSNRVELPPPLNEPDDMGKNQGSENFPVADFYEPAGFEWTERGYEVRSALKRYSEATNANR